MTENAVTYSLGYRRPGTSVIAECLRVQATVPASTAVQRLFGASPLGREAEPWYIGALGELEVARRLAGLGQDGACSTSCRSAAAGATSTMS